MPLPKSEKSMPDCRHFPGMDNTFKDRVVLMSDGETGAAVKLRQGGNAAPVLAAVGSSCGAGCRGGNCTLRQLLDRIK